MVNEAPKYITREELLEMISLQAERLPASEAVWLQEHRVDPFPARFAELSHYVVARRGNDVIFFSDDEDEFGIGTLTEEIVLENYGLFGDLIDAVRSFLIRPA